MIPFGHYPQGGTLYTIWGEEVDNSIGLTQLTRYVIPSLMERGIALTDPVLLCLLLGVTFTPSTTYLISMALFVVRMS